jgi:hypothetical protein
METVPPDALGDPLPDDAVVFRAFAKEGDRRRKPPKVRANAYLRAADHTDGLSLGRTPIAAVAGLDYNFGYCSIRVGDIHGLHIKLNFPRKLEVRQDLRNPDHILLCNLPFLTADDESRGWAQLIAGQLAKLSKPESFDQYPPTPSEELPSS